MEARRLSVFKAGLGKSLVLDATFYILQFIKPLLPRPMHYIYLSVSLKTITSSNCLGVSPFVNNFQINDVHNVFIKFKNYEYGNSDTVCLPNGDCM